MSNRLSDIRNEYSQGKLYISDLPEHPFVLLKKWLDKAIQNQVKEPTAMSLATADKNGQPSCRIVLLKEVHQDGLRFFTNYHSKKGIHLTENPRVAALLFWPEMERQIRIEGKVKKTTSGISDRYFHSRPFESQISSLVSPQSEVIQDPDKFHSAFEETLQQMTGKPLSRPVHWGGYHIVPSLVEFWQGRPKRMHDRYQYLLKNRTWQIQCLAP